MTRNVESRSPLRLRWLVIAIVGGLLAFAGTGCRVKTSSAGGANNEKAKEARKQAEAAALAAVKAAAESQAHFVHGAAKPSFIEKEEMVRGKPIGSGVTISMPSKPAAAAPPPAPPGMAFRPEAGAKANSRNSSPVVIRDRVTSDLPYPSEAEADENALLQAQKKITQALAAFDPPIRYEPSLNVVKNEFVRKDTRTVRGMNPQEQEEWKKLGYDKDRVFVEYDVEVTADQVRELRTQDRVGGALRVLGGLAAVALAGYLFLRMDEWTKGYLTSWLAFVAIALVGSVAVALVLV